MSNAAASAATAASLSARIRPTLARGQRHESSLANATATRGLGTTVLGATLHLKVPASTAAVSHAATLTITAVEEDR
jgi:hypothetical protein